MNMEPGYGICRPVESRDEAAPSHRTWKTPMKLAFPTAPTAPAAEEKKQTKNNPRVTLPSSKNRPRCPRLMSSMSPFVQTRSPQLLAGGKRRRTRCASPLQRAKESLSFARQDGLTNRLRLADPRLQAVGYGSCAGYADGRSPL